MVNQFQSAFKRSRVVLGALAKDVPSYVVRLMSNNRLYLALCNRNERLESSPDGQGYRCDWQWTSDLYLPKVFPIFGRRLYCRAFRDFPIELKACPDVLEDDKPDISFIIGHRGMERLPLLLTTLKSIAGQKGCKVECIVVEQDYTMIIRDYLPSWVRYIYTPPPMKEMAYSRAWAFNVGADVARSKLLIFHDNDLLCPATYSKKLIEHYLNGYEVINLKRFIFYLDKISAKQVCDQISLYLSPTIEAIMQNAEGGGSICITHEAYDEIGGFDERFIGWGGEDNEFWERACTRKLYPYGYLPFIHLWHKPQAGKHGEKISAGKQMYHSLSLLQPEERIADLKLFRQLKN